MLLENMICLFSNKGNDLFLSAESKKEDISNSKKSLVIVSKTKTIKTSMTTRKKSRKYDVGGIYGIYLYIGQVYMVLIYSRKLMNSMKFSSVG